MSKNSDKLCIAITRKGERCKLRGDSEHGGYCHIHKFLAQMERKNKDTETDDRLVKIVTVGTGLILLIEKAIEHFPALIIHFGDGTRMGPKRFIEEFSLPMNMPADDDMWFTFISSEVGTRIAFEFPPEMPENTQKELLGYVEELEQLCIPGML